MLIHEFVEGICCVFARAQCVDGGLSFDDFPAAIGDEGLYRDDVIGVEGGAVCCLVAGYVYACMHGVACKVVSCEFLEGVESCTRYGVVYCCSDGASGYAIPDERYRFCKGVSCGLYEFFVSAGSNFNGGGSISDVSIDMDSKVDFHHITPVQREGFILWREVRCNLVHRDGGGKGWRASKFSGALFDVFCDVKQTFAFPHTASDFPPDSGCYFPCADIGMIYIRVQWRITSCKDSVSHFHSSGRCRAGILFEVALLVYVVARGVYYRFYMHVSSYLVAVSPGISLQFFVQAAGIVGFALDECCGTGMPG